MSKVAVILIRGLVGVRADIRETLAQLGLQKKHTCVVLQDSDSVRGQLRKIADFVTYGELAEDSVKLLDEKRPRKDGQRAYFLAPPVGGFERKGIKKSFAVGGALGDRKGAIDELIKKMV